MIIQLGVEYDVDVVYSPENNSVTVGYYNLQAYMIRLFSLFIKLEGPNLPNILFDYVRRKLYRFNRESGYVEPSFTFCRVSCFE